MDYNFKTLNTLQYLGSKSRILNEICTELLEIDGIDTVVDLFAGTGTIGYAIQNYKRVFSNDLEEYAYVINDGILNGGCFSKEAEEALIYSIKQKIKLLEENFSEAIIAEAEYFNDSKLNYLNYREFCDATPSVIKPETKDKRLKCIENAVKKIHMGTSVQEIDLPVLFITYYANTYFGIKQCCEIDAIRSTISDLVNNKNQNIFLVGLMTAMSAVSSTTTHFAQYLKINSSSTCNNLVTKRKVSIFDYFLDVINNFRLIGLLEREEKLSQCTNLDYLEALNKLPLDDKVLVYADPPYFKEHYSRYYHILNTICRYDYPLISFNNQINDYTIGRYREDRNISDFGKRSRALKAFEELILVCSKNNSSLAISYSDNSLVKISDIVKQMENFYQLQIKEIPLKHSKQGRASTSDVNEVLIIGRPLSTNQMIGQKKVDYLLRKLSIEKPLYDNPASAMHNYMARKPFNIINTIIKELCPEEGVVYDPMFGSGTTLIEASKLGMSAVGSDINILAYKLANISLKSWDINRVQSVVQSFVCEIEEECNRIYLFENNEGTRIIERCHFDIVNNKLVPTSYWYKSVENNKKLSSRKQDVTNKKFIDQYNDIQNQPIEFIENNLLIPNSRIAISKGADIFSYFCFRNLYALNQIIKILRRYKNKYGYEILELIVSSAINLIRLSDKKASSQMPYWKPQKDVTSRNAVFVIKDKSNKVISGLEYLSQYNLNGITNNFSGVLNEKKILLRNTPAQKISYKVLPKNSVDLVLTDPPYTDQVPYLEYSQLWNMILGWGNLGEKFLENELIVSDAPSRKKDLNDFNKVLRKIMQRTVNSMKNDAHFVMFYHSFDLKSWSSIICIAEECGLSYQGQSPIPNQRKSFKTVMSPKSTLDGNYVIVFRKRKAHIPVFGDNLEQAVALAVNCAKLIVESKEKVTSQDIYDQGLLRESIEQGYLHILATYYNTFIDVILPYFKYEEGYWRVK